MKLIEVRKSELICKDMIRESEEVIHESEEVIRESEEMICEYCCSKSRCSHE